MPWQDVAQPQMLKLLTFYADQEDRKMSDRAEIYFGVAILLHEFDQPAESEEYRRKALRLAAYLRDEADRLLPQ